jgi:2-polyprenyl-3-methyl-5-hydroxy-6-metoxy-1,4-benzoquinol methylase
MNLITVNQCWCGSKDLSDFSDHYSRCKECNTLVCKTRLPEEFYKVGDDSENFYGEKYWTRFLPEEYGYQDIIQLSRAYLSERCIYWLRDILKYKLPPAKTLELGCAHGGLVFLMKLAGYDSTGSEMSQWICDYAQKTFNIPMMCGRIEDLNIPPKSFDIIILMDVLEHMTDPVGGLRSIANVLGDDGIVVIQTPCWREIEKTYDEMQAEKSVFLDQLKEKEHLYLFNEVSIQRILSDTGFSHIAFEPQIFSHDMFVFAGKEPLNKIRQERIVAELLKTPEKRIILALVDSYTRSEEKEKELNEKLSECEADRKARLEIIERQHTEFAKMIDECEADRAARLEVINKQAEDFANKEKNLEAHLKKQYATIQELQKELETLRRQIILRHGLK